MCMRSVRLMYEGTQHHTTYGDRKSNCSRGGGHHLGLLTTLGRFLKRRPVTKENGRGGDEGLTFPSSCHSLDGWARESDACLHILILDCEKKDAAAVADEMMRQQRTVVHAFFIRQKISTSQHKKRANVDVMEKKKIIVKDEKAHQRPKTSQDCLVCEL